MSGKHTLGWIGMGRMGYPMAERLLKAGNTVSIWNRTRAKAEPLAKLGGRVVETPADLAGCDLVFVMVSTGKDLEEVCFGKGGVAAGGKGKAPKVIVDCSSISVQESADCRAKLQALGVDFLAAPVSGNGKVVKAGKLCAVASGPKAAFETAKPYMLSFAPRGVSYVGEGELSRICKIAHNVMLGVVIQNLAEITILAREGRRAAPRVPGVHQQRRDGLDVHALQVQRASSTSTGPRRSRPSCCARTSTSGWRPAASSTCPCR